MPALVREVAAPREELLNRLEQVLGHADYAVTDGTVVISDGDRRIEMKIVEDGGGRPAAAAESRQVHFTFANMSDDEIRAFMLRWDEPDVRSAPTSPPG